MSEKIRVISRVRPLSERESERGDEVVVQISNEYIQISTQLGLQGSKLFKLDTNLETDSSQETVFSNIVRNLQSAIQGINSTVCTFGQTGSGKTYTMLGYDFWSMAQSESGEETFLNINYQDGNMGIIPRSLKWLFDTGVTDSISVSYIEIYNERVIDLLDGDYRENGIALEIREDKKGGNNSKCIINELFFIHDNIPICKR